MSRIAGSEHRGRDPRLPAAATCRSLSTLAAILLALLPIVARLAAGPQSRLPGADHLAAAAARNLAGAGRARASASLADLVAGHPIGQSMLLWTTAFLAFDYVDSRLGLRDYWMDWLLAAAAIALPRRRRLVHCAADGQRDRASPMMVPQIGLSILAYPIAARLVARARPLAAGAMIAAQRAPGHREQPGDHLLAPRLRARRAPDRRRRAARRRGWAISRSPRTSATRDLAEANRVQMRLIPPRRGWIVDRHGQPMAINRSDFRVDLIPDQLEDPERVIAELDPAARPRRRGGRSGSATSWRRRPASSRCRSPSISRFEKYCGGQRPRCPSCPASRRCAPSPATIRKAPRSAI